MNPIVNLELMFLHQTEGAVLFENESGAEVWVPKSACEFEPADPIRGDVVAVTMPEHTAIEKGLI